MINEEIWKRICETWYSVAPNALEKLYNSMPRRISDLIKQMGCSEIRTLLCRRTGMVLCFHWNEFKYVLVFSLECI